MIELAVPQVLFILSALASCVSCLFRSIRRPVAIAGAFLCAATCVAFWQFGAPSLGLAVVPLLLLNVAFVLPALLSSSERDAVEQQMRNIESGNAER